MILYQQCLGFQKSLVIELAEALKEKYRKREELLSTVSLLQEHVHYYQNHLNQIKCENEELGQYRRRCCVRIEGIPLVENETSDEVLGKVMSLMDEAECDIPEVVIDRAHRMLWLILTTSYKSSLRIVEASVLLMVLAQNVP